MNNWLQKVGSLFLNISRIVNQMRYFRKGAAFLIVTSSLYSQPGGSIKPHYNLGWYCNADSMIYNNTQSYSFLKSLCTTFLPAGSSFC